ncbi:efflux RND transporter periplasmic adaptor subunit [Metabacillus fastidiosus]|uniref:efflux RND transporter periplasmic adaptor subunit n=1 Tax=Metabacillus fastidiosus TaxID=1458 RepID=UPI002E216DBA|nr:efflux RND transporter periplasmic adaptor subunit [Metabacillus fastidiosus]MED4455992.1 efflux RND transporter periplasmic adaptor subunit [Metabacillus fastidiosus]
MKKLVIVIFTTIFVSLFILNMFLLLTDDKVTRSIQMNEHIFAKKDDMRETLDTKGIVKPGDEYSVRYKTEMGEISTVYVDEGDTVEAGSMLFAYDSSKIDRKIEKMNERQTKITGTIKELESEIIKLESEQKSSSGTLTEQEEAKRQNDAVLATSKINQKQDDIKDYELKITEMEQEISELEAEKEGLVIKSKIAGTVKEVNRVAEEDDDIVMLLQTEHPNLVEGKITEEEAVKLEEGQKALVTADVIPNKTYSGTIDRLTMIPLKPPSLEESQTIYPYIVQLTDETKKLHHGYHMNVQFVLKEREQAIIIPESAIMTDGEKEYVYIIKYGQLHKTNIVKGIQIRRDVEIVKGLKEGDRLVPNPTPFLKNKMDIFTTFDESKLSKKLNKSLKADEKALLMLKGFTN